MKFTNIKLLLLSSALFLSPFFILTPPARATVNDVIGPLRLKYERLYKRYTQNLANGVSSDNNALARQVAIAKRAYEDAINQVRIPSKSKSNFKNRIKKATTTLKRAFNNGITNKTNYTPKENSRLLPGFATTTVSINGNNYCGQFSVTMALKGMGIPTTGQDVYKATNPAGIFTSSPSMIRYLEMHGLASSAKEKASIGDITKRLDNGTPVIALVNADGTPHWVCIIGYDKDSSGKIANIITRDSYWGTKSPHKIQIDEFKKIWKTPVAGFLGNIENYSNYMISIDGRQTPKFSPPLYPANFWTASEDNFGSGINDTVAGFKDMDITQFAGGTVKLALGIPGSALAVTSNLMFKGGDKVVSWGKTKWAKGGIFNKILGGSAVVSGYATKVAAAVGRGAASLVSSAAAMIGNGVEKLGYVFAR